MLRELTIHNVLLIEALELQFQPGLNVLTGETGAGKSILLDALGLVLGWRGRADIVRAGAEFGEVTAEFDLVPDHPARAVLQEAGFPVEDQLLLRRINGSDGRKRGFVNDRRASGDVLRALSATLVELHGQHDDRGLLDPKGHRAMLDAFGALEGDLSKLQKAWRLWAEARKQLRDAQALLEEAARDAEYLRHAVDELEALAPEEGEEESLDIRRRQMQAAEKSREDVGRAFTAMGTDGAEGRLGDAHRWLETLVEGAEGMLDPALEALSRAMNELGDAQMAVSAYADASQFDPHELENTEERLFAIRALARKHNVLPDALPELAAEFRGRVDQIDCGEETLTALSEIADQAQAEYDQAAGTLSKKRQSAAKNLDKAMAAELAPLKLERAQFETKISLSDPGPDGIDHVAFTIATNPGAPAGPLNKIASGGELSRFLLALKVCLTKRSKGLTMIFDEIDRGVGGATANAVGRRLAQVAAGSQVLVVTHSPQVAALGTHHWKVVKSVTNDVTRSDVIALDMEARINEIARMLAGDTVTDEARSAAMSLLND